MTRELLQTANQINHDIQDLENQIRITESMLHDSDKLKIFSDEIGSVTLSQEARLDVLNLVLGDLNTRKEELEDRLRML